MKDVLNEAMDLEGFERVLGDLVENRIRCVAVDSPVPSPFSHEILNANPYAYLDDAPLEERRARAVQMRRSLPDAVLSEVGRLDPAAIAEVREEAWPDVRDAEELHDVLLTLVALPASAKAGPHQNNHLDEKLRASIPAWSEFSKQLAARRRAALAQVGGLKYWVSAERAKDFVQVFPAACFEPLLPDLESKAASREDVLLALTAGWMAHCGPLTANALGETLETPVADIERTLLRMEASGAVLRGRFTDSAAGETEWCDRRLLARIHRLTLGTLRKQIAPVTPAEFMRWLFRWQHVASCFTDIVRGTGRLKAEVETALWELVAAGVLTADGFDNLRALIDPQRRAGRGRGRSARPRHSAGRWSLLYAGETVDRSRALEATCWMLLRRNGVVFRDVLARE